MASSVFCRTAVIDVPLSAQNVAASTQKWAARREIQDATVSLEGGWASIVSVGLFSEVSTQICQRKMNANARQRRVIVLSHRRSMTPSGQNGPYRPFVLGEGDEWSQPNRDIHVRRSECSAAGAKDPITFPKAAVRDQTPVAENAA